MGRCHPDPLAYGRAQSRRMMHVRLLPRSWPVLVAGLLVAGCGSSGDSGSTSTSSTTSTSPPTASACVRELAHEPVDCALPTTRCVDGSPGPTQEYATIQACADAAAPGDSCVVFPGSYDERVTPPTSGTAGHLITFRASGAAVVRGFDLSGRSYLRVAAFEITTQGMTSDGVAALFLEASDHVEIAGNHVHDTDGGTCVRLRDVDGLPSNDVVVRDNVLSRCAGPAASGGGIGVAVFGDRNLVEHNDISHLADDYTRVTGGERNVLRNNCFHDNTLSDAPGSTAHIDGMQNWCSDGGLRTRYLLVEGNRMLASPSPDTHFVIYQDYGACGNGDFLVRHNLVHECGDYPQIHDAGTERVRLYRNTFATTSAAQSPRPWESVGFSGDSPGGALVANVFVDAVRDGAGVYYVDATSLPGFVAHHNLAYNTDCGATCSFIDPILSEVGAVLGLDPNFAGLGDFHLAPGSPAIDAGGWLTTVAAADAGSGTTLLLDDAGFFQDGWAGTDPDWIAVGTAAVLARILSIDYAANAVTLASDIARAPGDVVALARLSDGTEVLHGPAPDIGTFESP